MATKNLGLVKAIHSGSTAPSNTQMLWYDTGSGRHKYYDTVTAAWQNITTRKNGIVINSDTTLTSEYDTVVINANANSVELTLPDPADSAYDFIWVTLYSFGYDSGASEYYEAIVSHPSLVWANNEFKLINSDGVRGGRTLILKSGEIGGTFYWGVVSVIRENNNIGTFADEATLNAALPVGLAGWYALVLDTNSFWVWDANSSTWVDSAYDDSDYEQRKGRFNYTGNGEYQQVTFDKPYSVALTDLPTININGWGKVDSNDSDIDAEYTDMAVNIKDITNTGFKVSAAGACKIHYNFQL